MAKAFRIQNGRLRASGKSKRRREGDGKEIRHRKRHRNFCGTFRGKARCRRKRMERLWTCQDVGEGKSGNREQHELRYKDENIQSVYGGSKFYESKCSLRK